MTSGQTAVTTRQPAERLASWQAMDSGRLLLLAAAGTMAYALLLYVGQLPGHGKPIQVSPLQVIAVAAIAMTIGALPHMAAGRPAGLTGMASRLVAVSCVAFAFRPLTN